MVSYHTLLPEIEAPLGVWGKDGWAQAGRRTGRAGFADPAGLAGLAGFAGRAGHGQLKPVCPSHCSIIYNTFGRPGVEK